MEQCYQKCTRGCGEAVWFGQTTLTQTEQKQLSNTVVEAL